MRQGGKTRPHTRLSESNPKFTFSPIDNDTPNYASVLSNAAASRKPPGAAVVAVGASKETYGHTNPRGLRGGSQAAERLGILTSALPLTPRDPVRKSRGGRGGV